MGSEERERREGEEEEEEDGGDAVCIIHLSLDRKIRSAQLRSRLPRNWNWGRARMNEASAWKGGELEGLGKNARSFKQCAAKSDMHDDNFAIGMSYVSFFPFSTCAIGYQPNVSSYHSIESR